MSAPAWEPAWLMQHAAELGMAPAWRGVETQYIAASLKLVDTLQEHELLELLLEGSKPPGVPGARHYLLLSPFRYFPPHASRFRPGQRSGLWYGASTLEGACSEIAYWRMRFIQDSAGLVADGELVTEHTFYHASVRGHAIDLMAEPWVRCSALWKHPADYSATQQLAQAAIEASIEWIRYESVRAPHCALAAVLTPNALFADSAELERSRQEWICKASKDRVMMLRKSGTERFAWSE
ncbi:RES family NAD+ phosphorylase [Comamonas endophytica]|uniref:RES family NAD+ phosphorylase n=1 Tax=Comamonas endophytica TaxID=2949090 RepID=A0ABY6GAP8_9BURK|nr:MULTISPECIES: RES family NAD+ phosphorylase [unclassified Acidovorax]MCD2512165.1 RES family NAD+ phosphorylase [Acidovorax sp. D4N7]UYG51938.1 RES family NAD+ phosphorylase [Acidovorax sp. 5MLIR]